MLIYILEVFQIYSKSFYTIIIQLKGAHKMTCQTDLFKLDSRLVDQNQRLLQHLNTGRTCSRETNQLLSEIFGYQLDPTNEIRLPFHTDYGRNIKLGKNIFINCNVTMIDIGTIKIGDDVIIGPDTTLLTTDYSTSKEKPIVIGENVNIGGHVTILPGVTIGQGAIIIAGSVVTTDIEENVTVSGNPAHIIKEGNK